MHCSTPLPTASPAASGPADSEAAVPVARRIRTAARSVLRAAPSTPSHPSAATASRPLGERSATGSRSYCRSRACSCRASLKLQHGSSGGEVLPDHPVFSYLSRSSAGSAKGRRSHCPNRGPLTVATTCPRSAESPSDSIRRRHRGPSQRLSAVSSRSPSPRRKLHQLRICSATSWRATNTEFVVLRYPEIGTRRDNSGLEAARPQFDPLQVPAAVTKIASARPLTNAGTRSLPTLTTLTVARLQACFGPGGTGGSQWDERPGISQRSFPSGRFFS